mgnify:FL=1
MFAEFGGVPVFLGHYRNDAVWFLCLVFEIVFYQYEARIRSVIVQLNPLKSVG